MSTADSYPLDPVGGVDAEQIARAWRRERPQTPVESIAIVTPLWRLAKLLADDRRRHLAQTGVDAATMDLLSALRRSGKPYTLSTRDLADHTLVTAGAISQRVARAERDGLVRRFRPAEGGRTVLVEMTTDGHRLVESTVDHILSRENELIDTLSEADRADLARILSHWLSDLQSRLP